jgi:3-oxoacyl-[acyl-carrier protein] reductase
MELQGQVAIVTGAGRGIGRATALELARLGANIVVAELDEGGADKTAALVQDAGRRAAVISTDVTKRAELAAMVERTRRVRPDRRLVNNAGI